MQIRLSLLALSALALPALAAAQWGVPMAPSPPQMPRAPVAEPWMAQPAPPQGQPWQSATVQGDRSPKLEPIDLPPAIEQGVDMIYIDEDLVPRAVHDGGPLGDMTNAAWTGAPVDLFTSVNPIYTDRRRGLVKYRQRWGSLPEIAIPAGP